MGFFDAVSHHAIQLVVNCQPCSDEPSPRAPSREQRRQVFLALDKSPLLFRPVSLRGVLARPDEIAEQIASNYAVDALLRSLAVVGSLEALGSPTTLLSEWGKGVYDLFAMPIKAMPQVCDLIREQQGVDHIHASTGGANTPG